MGVLELTALPSLDAERWVPLVRETDVLLVEGGDAAFLCHWMLASGLADLLPSLPETRNQKENLRQCEGPCENLACPLDHASAVFFSKNLYLNC